MRSFQAGDPDPQSVRKQEEDSDLDGINVFEVSLRSEKWKQSTIVPAEDLKAFSPHAEHVQLSSELGC